MNKLEYVNGLTFGNVFFKNGDEVSFKVKDESNEYAAKLYDIGEHSFIAYGSDETEYNFNYKDIEWMKVKRMNDDMDRKNELLIAAYKLLNKQNNSPYVLNMLSTTVNYDDTECDGNCLMEDIQNCLFEEGIDVED